MNKKIKFKFSKNGIAKWILSVLVVLISFILINLIIWAFKYGWVSRYTTLLDHKNWSTSISQMSISNPVAIFYDNTWISNDKNLSQDKDSTSKETQKEDGQKTDTKNTVENTKEDKDSDIDPYDPEFENEFNSFFGWENSKLNDNTTDVAVGANNESHAKSTKKDHSIIKRLIQKFNE